MGRDELGDGGGREGIGGYWSCHCLDFLDFFQLRVTSLRRFVYAVQGGERPGWAGSHLIEFGYNHATTLTRGRGRVLLAGEGFY